MTVGVNKPGGCQGCPPGTVRLASRMCIAHTIAPVIINLGISCEFRRLKILHLFWLSTEGALEHRAGSVLQGRYLDELIALLGADEGTRFVDGSWA